MKKLVSKKKKKRHEETHNLLIFLIQLGEFLQRFKCFFLLVSESDDFGSVFLGEKKN